MKLTKSLSIVAMAYVALYLGVWGILEISNSNDSIVALTMYSDYEFNQITNQKDIADKLHIIQLDEKTIQQYPVLLELVEENQKKDNPSNPDGKAKASYEQVKKETEYLASIFVKQYEGAWPEDYYRELKKDNGWHSITIKEPYFYHNGILYLINPDIIVISEGEPKVGIVKVCSNYHLGDNLVMNITDEDFENMPRFKEALDQIGTFEENVQSRKNMGESEFREYEDWAMNTGLADERIVFDYGFIEYGDRYYHLYLRP